MKVYLDLLRDIRENGEAKHDRTGVGTLSVFGRQLRFNLEKGFPAVTTKRLFIKGAIYELLWFLRGDTNIRYLQEHGVTIWDEWADESGELGPVYGAQWRRWNTASGEAIDQIAKVIEEIKTNPNSRRLVVSAWNVGNIEQMKLPPCHCICQFYVVNNRLSCHVYQRSADMFLGVPFNIASYALLTLMAAQVTKLQPGDLILSFGDAHIYLNHLRQVDTQLSREPRPLPRMELNPGVTSIFDFKYEDFELVGYNPYPPIKGEIAI